MTWKQDLQLQDLEKDVSIECECLKCGYSFYLTPGELLANDDGKEKKYLYLDEIESWLACRQWGCSGNVRIALPDQDETEGFQGGLA